MKLTKQYVEGVFKTLPIGYYLGRDIACSIEENEETSYFSRTEQKIVISYEQVVEACKHCVDMETALRSILYHEVSHTILTPRELQMDNIVNTFEDERIETLLNNYYMGIDFWKNRLAVNGYNSIEEIKKIPLNNDFQRFYALVRFHIGSQNFLDRVDKLIQEYKDLRWNTENSYGNWRVTDYNSEIWNLYRSYCNNPPTDEEIQQSIEKMFGGEGITPDTADQGEYTAGQPNGEGLEMSDQDEGEQGRHKGLGHIDVASLFTPTYDMALKEQIEEIFRQFNSRATFSGGATCGYSGIIDPRLCARDDYRYFMRKSQKGGMNGFSKFNLNLFIDDSGSFHDSKNIVNNLLAILIEIEKANPDFSLTVIKCGDGQEIMTKDRHIDCNDGTDLTEDIKWQFPQVQKAGYVNYNILLYDGSATYSYTQERYKVFNTNNTTIIIDTEDASAVKKYCPNARKIIVQNDYANHLIENIINTLKVAMR
jgi:hypothetical protein